MFLDYIKIICFLTGFFYFIEKTNKSLNKVTIVGLFLMEQLTLFLVEKIKTQFYLEVMPLKIAVVSFASFYMRV